MRELTDAQIEAMTPEEKAEYARLRAAAKYHQPHLDRDGDGGNKGTLLWGVAIAAAVVVSAGFVWAMQGRTADQMEHEVDRVQREQQKEFRDAPKFKPPPTVKFPNTR